MGYDLPVHEGLSTKDHGEELGWVLCCVVSGVSYIRYSKYCAYRIRY